MVTLVLRRELWAVNSLTVMIGSKQLRGLEPADVERAFRKADYSRESFIKLRSVLGKALDCGVRRKLIHTNVARHIELPADAPEPRTAEPSPSNRRSSCVARQAARTFA